MAPCLRAQAQFCIGGCVLAHKGRGRGTVSLYQRMLRSRKLLDPEAPLDWVPTGHDDVLAFRRADITVVLNVSPDPVVLTADLVAGAEVVLTSWAGEAFTGTLPGDATVWLRR